MVFSLVLSWHSTGKGNEIKSKNEMRAVGLPAEFQIKSMDLGEKREWSISWWHPQIHLEERRKTN
jgi:hypothetical protein